MTEREARSLEAGLLQRLFLADVFQVPLGFGVQLVQLGNRMLGHMIAECGTTADAVLQESFRGFLLDRFTQHVGPMTTVRDERGLTSNIPPMMRNQKSAGGEGRGKPSPEDRRHTNVALDWRGP